MAATVKLYATYGSVTYTDCPACLRDGTLAVTTTYILSGERVTPLSLIRYCPACKHTESKPLWRPR